MMDTLIDIASKFFIPTLSLIVSIVALRSGWIYTSDRIFSQRSELSKFAYNLYQQFGDETLEKIAKEYGYAALTRDKGLNTEQRLVLLSSVDPVTDIEQYSKCSNYLSVNTNINSFKFSWIKRRHKYKVYRGIVELIFLVCYFFGLAMLLSPIMAPSFLDGFIMEKFSVLLLWKKIAIISYLMIGGGFVAFLSLNQISKLNMAVRLMKKNRPSFN